MARRQKTSRRRIAQRAFLESAYWHFTNEGLPHCLDATPEGRRLLQAVLADVSKRLTVVQLKQLTAFFEDSMTYGGRRELEV